EHLNKYFGGHCVVNSVSLEVSDGELFVLLGPSGSGKSTILRMIAGLLDVEEGRVLLNGRDVTTLSPQRRDVGFVFQNYALFRHMSVADNIEFPLRIRKVPAAERRRRRNELLEIVGLVGFEKRMPHQLSGGQQQRVALARALSHRPEVLLLDEPFGALDAKIRAELRRSLRRIQSELGVTTIFVTHDQEEGLELADRMGVMNFGRLLEVGPPTELYLRPQTEFVATFLGKANLMVGECSTSGVVLGPKRIPLEGRINPTGDERRVQVLFRPEDVAVESAQETLGCPALGQATVEEAGFAGAVEKMRLRLPPLPKVRTISPPVPFGASYVLVEATRSQHQARSYPLRAGDKAWVGVRRIHALLHPGLSLLLVLDDTPEAEAVLASGAQIARLAHARVTVLGLPSGGNRDPGYLDRARETMGSGLASLELRSSPDAKKDAVKRETERQHYDLVIHALPAEARAETAEQILADGDHQLLFLPPGHAVPRRVLICVAGGEPGKNDVAFAGRFLRHLGAQATVLTVLPGQSRDERLARGRRFLDACARTLSVLGVEGSAKMREGRTHEEISSEIKQGDYDMVVLGTPLAGRNGRATLEGLAGDLVRELNGLAVLFVRSRERE
ncbi:MAG: ATP-binding cassette domain-containing protein, partial [Candidatus Eisenbacteria bacterium]